MGRSDEANDAYREAFRIDPKFKLAQRNLLKALLRSGLKAEAEVVARKAAAQYKDASGFETQLGETLVQIGKPHEALVAFLEAYERGDHSPESMKQIRELGGTVPGR
jgi:tetratricopeptide (TPR) repeat protein